MLDRRKIERDILNEQRFKEREKNRPPEDRWYMRNDGEFSKELYRNRVSLRPHNENQAYLETLKDSNVY